MNFIHRFTLIHLKYFEYHRSSTGYFSDKQALRVQQLIIAPQYFLFSIPNTQSIYSVEYQVWNTRIQLSIIILSRVLQRRLHQCSLVQKGLLKVKDPCRERHRCSDNNRCSKAVFLSLSFDCKLTKANGKFENDNE